MPNSEDVANVATISQALNQFNEQNPNKAVWKLSWDDDGVQKWSVGEHGWVRSGHYSWSEIRETWNCGFRVNYTWLKNIVSHDATHRKFFYEVFYGPNAKHKIDWDLEPWTEPPSAPYQYLSGGRLYWSDLPR